MAFKFIENYEDNQGQKMAHFECDFCEEAVTRFIPYSTVKCDNCGQGYPNPRWYFDCSKHKNRRDKCNTRCRNTKRI